MKKVAISVLLLAAALGCGDENVDEGSIPVSFALELPGSDGPIVLESVNYIITKPDGWRREGQVDVAHSTRPQFVVGGMAPGDYVIEINGKALDGVTTCTGASAPFTVTAGMTTGVVLTLSCKQPKRNGSISINGVLNVCPGVEDPSATPSQVVVGGSIAVEAAASDADMGPIPLVGTWSASPAIGKFDDPAAKITTFHCEMAGAANLIFSASDGDPACRSSGKVTVFCEATCEDDHDPCTRDVCMPDGSTSHVPSDWPGCPAAATDLAHLCPGRTGPLSETEISLLDACSGALGEELAQGGELDTVWAQFTACVRSALKCSPPEEAFTAALSLAPNSGGVCNQAGYQACAQNALETFGIAVASCSVAAAAVALVPALGFPGSAAAYALCILAATVAEDLMIRLCIAHNSCTATQVCVQPMCVDAIDVVSASYGAGNCGTAVGNVTGNVVGTCNGKQTCDVFVHNSVFGDPRYGCPKDFTATYRCGSGVKTASHGPVAGEGYSVTLSCP